jgi:hypothetical protein
MHIVTLTATNFPIPSTCPFCDGKFHKHGKRKRHVIEQEKIWYTVKRVCCSICGATLTLLLDNMLPYKHYSAHAIEQVLRRQENPTGPPHECGAEESTLYRWICEFPDILTALVFRLSSLAKTAINLLSEARPLQRLYDVLNLLPPPSPDSSRLAWAFFLDKSYPVHLG